jgi:hypothetical protein
MMEVLTMYKISSNFHMSLLRHRGVAWLLLVIFISSLVPSVSSAQQPTATISALSGMVLVNGQEKGKDTVLNAGDVLEIQA